MEPKYDGAIYQCILSDCAVKVYKEANNNRSFSSARKIITSVLQEKLDEHQRLQRDAMKRILNYNE